MLQACMPKTTNNDVKNPGLEEALDRLKRDYLPMWAATAYGAAVGRGAPGEVPYADYMKGSVREFDYSGDERDNWVCNLVEAGIEEIAPKIPFARAALSVRYVRGAQEPPAVYRSGRTERAIQLDDIADRAELALVPICRRRGLPL